MIAKPLNEIGRKLQQRGHLKAAGLAYALASRLAPEWPAPWFNRGLMAKFAHDWPDCYRFTLKSTELDPSYGAAWWNLGIAATALADWVVARRAWWRYGIEVPLGEGPPDMDLGLVPIRICPETLGEVVWCCRLDPARASIQSIPTPESAHAQGDILLTDGEPMGYRSLFGREVSVFNELELLVPSRRRTFWAEVVAPTEEDFGALREAAEGVDVGVEDLKNIRYICKACSEGRPHEHEHGDEAEEGWQPNRRLGLAALDEPVVTDLLEDWAEAAPGRSVLSLECVFSRV